VGKEGGATNLPRPFLGWKRDKGAGQFIVYLTREGTRKSQARTGTKNISRETSGYCGGKL